MLDCAAILHSTGAPEAIVAACYQTEAAIHAARVQAHATVLAGWLTFLAGSAALGAGALAYRGSLRQVRLAEEQHSQKIVAYHRHIRTATARALNEIENARNIAMIAATKNRTMAASVTIPADFSSSCWQDHALLTKEIAFQIIVANEALVDYQAVVTALRDPRHTEPVTFELIPSDDDPEVARLRTDVEILADRSGRVEKECTNLLCLLDGEPPPSDV